jgi:hypothetical protein
MYKMCSSTMGAAAAPLTQQHPTPLRPLISPHHTPPPPRPPKRRPVPIQNNHTHAAGCTFTASHPPRIQPCRPRSAKQRPPHAMRLCKKCPSTRPTAPATTNPAMPRKRPLPLHLSLSRARAHPCGNVERAHRGDGIPLDRVLHPRRHHQRRRHVGRPA